MAEIQKQQIPTKPNNKAIITPTKAAPTNIKPTPESTTPRSTEKFTSTVSLDQFLAPPKEKKKKEEKAFSWGTQSGDAPSSAAKPKPDLAACLAEEQAKGRRNQTMPQTPPPPAVSSSSSSLSVPSPSPIPPTPSASSAPSSSSSSSSVSKPKVNLAAYINAEQIAKDQRIKALKCPPKPIALIELEERDMQLVARLHAEELQAVQAFEAAEQAKKKPSHKPKNKNNSNKNKPTNNNNKKSPRKCEVETRPMEIKKFAS